MIALKNPNLKKHDLLVTTPATGNLNYINFIKDMTLTRDEVAK